MNLSLTHSMVLPPLTLAFVRTQGPAISMNRIQFQPGVSMPEFFARYGSEEQCAAALRAMRLPDGFRCPRCDGAENYVVGHGARPVVPMPSLSPSDVADRWHCAQQHEVAAAHLVLGVYLVS